MSAGRLSLVLVAALLAGCGAQHVTHDGDGDGDGDVDADSDGDGDCYLNSGYPCYCENDVCGDGSLCAFLEHVMDVGFCSAECTLDEPEPCFATRGFGDVGLCALSADGFAATHCLLFCTPGGNPCPPGLECIDIDGRTICM